MDEIWYRTASDEEIAKCQGDYIGCEICRNQKRCFELMAQRLQKATDENEQASKQRSKKDERQIDGYSERQSYKAH